MKKHGRQYLLVLFIIRNKSAIMLSSSKNRTGQEVVFVLQNLFIFAPDPHSRYKLRLVVRNHSEEERVSQEQKHYRFHFLFEDALSTDEQDGEIYLLEKEKRQTGTQEYRTIGIGRFDLLSCRQREHYSPENRLVNGLIYGTNEVNGEKIIAKFSYRMLKEQKKDETNEFLSIQPLTISRRRDKFPMLTFRQSITDKNTEIQSKLNDLTRQLDETFRKDKSSNDKMKQLSETIVETLKEFSPQKKDYCYRYSEKMRSLLQNSANRFELYSINIKSIKICDTNFRKWQRSPYEMGIYSSKNEEWLRKSRILMSFFQIVEKFQFRRKLIELVIPIVYNENNNFPQGINFYLPMTANRILLEIRSLEKSQEQAVVGYIKFGYNFNKIIEVFDKDNQQKGFIIALIEQHKSLSETYLNDYQLQLHEYQRIIAENRVKECREKRHSLPIERGQRQKDRLVISRVVKAESAEQAEDHFTSKNKQKKFRKVISPQFFGLKTQQSEITPSRSRFIMPVQSSALNKSRIKQYSMPSSSSCSKDRGKVRLLNYNNSRRNFKFHQKLHLKSISLSFDSPSLVHVHKVLLRLQLNQEIRLKKILVSRGQEAQWCDLDLHFETPITVDDRLKLSCYLKDKRGGESNYRELGRCSTSIQEIKNAVDSLYCMLLVNANKIIGKIQLKFNLNQSRVLQQISRPQEEVQKQEEYELSLGSSVTNQFGRKSSRISKKSFNQASERSQRKSDVNKQPIL